MAGRRVKIQDTGQYGNSEEAFRAPNKKYYSSEEAWQNIQLNNQYRDKCIQFVMDLLGYRPGMKLPTLTYKKIKEYEEPYGLDVLYETMLSCEQSCTWALQNKQFTGEVAKIMYIFAIFQNNAMDQWKKKVAKKRDLYIAESQSKDFATEDVVEYVPKVKNDIRRFLND